MDTEIKIKQVQNGFVITRSDFPTQIYIATDSIQVKEVVYVIAVSIEPKG